MHKFKSVKLTSNLNNTSFLKRFLAYLTDIFIVNLIITLPFRRYLANISNIDFLFSPRDHDLLLISLFIIIVLIFYFSFLEYKTGQTLGKMIMNIYAVSVIDKKLNLSQAVLRNITKPFPIVLLVDVAYMFFKGENRRLFDVLSGTAVVEKEIILK